MVIHNTPRSFAGISLRRDGLRPPRQGDCQAVSSAGTAGSIVSSHAHPESAGLPYEWISLKQWQFQQPWPVVINTAPVEVISDAMVEGWQENRLSSTLLRMPRGQRAGI